MPDCQGILEHIKPGWTGVEIGVRTGESAAALCSRCAYMYLIDPWLEYDEYPEKVHEDNYHHAMKALASFTNYQVIRLKSEEAAPMIPPVDFVWIDGNHTYKYVQRDLDLYYPKARYLICGHDYQNDNRGMIEVKRAVNDWALEHNVEVIPGGCWMIWKN